MDVLLLRLFCFSYLGIGIGIENWIWIWFRGSVVGWRERGGMKSSLRKLRGFALHRHDPKEKREHQPPAHQDELLQASQVLSSFTSFPSLYVSLSPFLPIS